MFLEEIDLFKGIAPGIIHEISDYAQEQVFAAGQVLFTKGEFAEHLYILVEGAVDLTGEEQVHASFPVNKPGDVFGWSALVEPHLYTAKAETASESKVLMIRGEHLKEIFKKYPSEALILMKRIAKIAATRPLGKFTLRFQGTS